MIPIAPTYLNSKRLTNQNSALANSLSDYPYYWDFVNVNIKAKADGSMIVEEVQKYTFNKPWTNERHRFILLVEEPQLTSLKLGILTGNRFPIHPLKQT